MAIDLARMEKRLTEELALLEEELRSVGRVNPANPADWEARPPELNIPGADPNETADRVEGYEENTAILKELEIRYNNVKKALARIKEGTYGVCEVGGEPIPEERLEANPAAATCLAHAPAPESPSSGRGE